MRKNLHLLVLKPLLLLMILFFCSAISAQDSVDTKSLRRDFWRNVQFGGGLGLSFSTGYTDITIAPSAIYNVNATVSVGTSLRFGYISAKNDYSSYLYGASLIGLINPIPEIQLSAELEEINFNTNYHNIGGSFNESLWNTSLYLGAGYRSGNVIVGVRYNVLFDTNKGYYNEPFMPFVRAYF